MTLQEAYIMPQGAGDIASGKIRLVYEMGGEERVYEVPYDTKGGPDGLSIQIDCSPGDKVHCTFEDKSISDETLTKQMYDHASKTLQHYYSEAVQGKGATSQGSVVFSGVVGASDNWLPEN